MINVWLFLLFSFENKELYCWWRPSVAMLTSVTAQRKCPHSVPGVGVVSGYGAIVSTDQGVRHVLRISIKS